VVLLDELPSLAPGSSVVLELPPVSSGPEVELVEVELVVTGEVAPVVGVLVDGSALVLEVALLDVSGADCSPLWGQADASKAELNTMNSGRGRFIGTSRWIVRCLRLGVNARRRAARGR
jgi:hypothetical protein